MSKSFDIGTNVGVDTSLFVQKDANGAIEELDGCALTNLTPANLDDTGTIPSGLLPDGSKIKQVVHTKQTSDFTSTSNVYTDVITCNITPTADDSTILVQAFVPMHISRNADQLYGDYLIMRDSVNLNDRHPNGGRGIHERYLTSHNDAAKAGITSQNTWVGIDAPESTSELTYKIQSRDTNNGGQNSDMNIDGAYLILMEIAA